MSSSGSDADDGRSDQTPEEQSVPRERPREQRSAPGQSGGGFLSERSKQYVLGIVGTLAALSVGIFLAILLLGSVGGPELTPEQELGEQQQQLLNDTYQFGLVQTAVGTAPYLGLVVAAVFGLRVGTRLSEPQNERFKTSAIGAFAGVAVFVFLTIFLGSTQIPDLPNTGQNLGGLTGTSLDTAQLLINSVVFGAIGAVVSVGATYFADRME